jgi:hypothetical protein
MMAVGMVGPVVVVPVVVLPAFVVPAVVRVFLRATGAPTTHATAVRATSA